ncbi:hypothetical protein [Pasteurella multocida]|uniref:hypothetical protein n=1 Tax=Pasteurella multocida TaxID=747 RepID=UPI000BBD11A3|nr:hypothetical protein [Pasteurella multocida]ATF75818.1 hypothetical protein CO688_10650 [Pasteurella multocida]ATN18218.1 hypothetical protein CRN72_10940 [Pasteurella multocida]MCL7818334.1 hypothetical protein [Pasteurella multocida]URJ96420.1 hypothetical protein M9413_06260 [Pasteurella multocida]HDR0618391.1 hypothetical protein [Pasteurella multocida]
MKSDHPSGLIWFIAMLPYEIGLLFAIFGSATIGQVFFWGLITQLAVIFLFFVFRYPFTALFGLFFWNS